MAEYLNGTLKNAGFEMLRITNNFIANAQKIALSDYEKQCSEIMNSEHGGQVLPITQTLLTKDAKAEISAIAPYKKIEEIYNANKQILLKEIYTPPTQDALNLIDALQSKKDFTKTDAQGADSQYGDNKMFCDLINELCEDAGLNVRLINKNDDVLECLDGIYSTCRELIFNVTNSVKCSIQQENVTQNEVKKNTILALSQGKLLKQNQGFTANEELDKDFDFYDKSRPNF